jgi:hypothetical protein
MNRSLLFLVVLAVVTGSTALAGQPDQWFVRPTGLMPVEGRVFVIPGKAADEACRVEVCLEGLAAGGFYALVFDGGEYLLFNADDTGAFTFRFEAPDAQCVGLQPTIFDFSSLSTVGEGYWPPRRAPHR